MGRRRKHDGDLGLASDQIPGQNQNNIRYQALSLSAVAPPGLSQRYDFGLYRTTAENCKHQARSLAHSIASVGSRRGQGPLGKQRDRVQAVEIQG